MLWYFIGLAGFTSLVIAFLWVSKRKQQGEGGQDTLNPGGVIDGQIHLDLAGVTRLSEDEVAALKRQPNYRDPRPMLFIDHEDFVSHLWRELAPYFVGTYARAIVLAHAAMAGWHIAGRPPLYGNNFWGQLTTVDRINAGDPFTIVNSPSGFPMAIRWYPNSKSCIEGFIANMEAYSTNPIAFVNDTTKENFSETRCYQYVTEARFWLAQKYHPLTHDARLLREDFGHDIFWICNNKILIAPRVI